MNLLHHVGPFKHSQRRLFPFFPGDGDKFRVHGLEFISFTLYCRPQIGLGISNPAHGLEMPQGVDRFSRGRRPKQFGNLLESFLVSLPREGKIFTVCLALTGKSRRQVVHCFSHDFPLTCSGFDVCKISVHPETFIS